MKEHDDEFIVCLCRTVNWLEEKVSTIAKDSQEQMEALMKLKMEAVDAYKYGIEETTNLAKSKLSMIASEMTKQKVNYGRSLEEIKGNYKLLYRNFAASSLAEGDKQNVDCNEDLDNGIKAELFENYKLQIERFEKLYQRHCLLLTYAFTSVELNHKVTASSRKETSQALRA